MKENENGKKKSFLVYYDMIEQLDVLTDVEVCMLFRAVILFAKEGVIPTFDDKALTVLFLGMKSQIERDAQRYQERCNKNRNAANNRWRKDNIISSQQTKTDANACNRMQTDADIDIDTDIDTDTDTDIVTENVCSSDKDISNIDYKKVIDWYNNTVKPIGLPTIMTMNNKRITLFKKIITEYGRNSLIKAFEMVKRSSYLRGDTNRQIKMSFDWLFTEDNYVKVLEGKYDD